MPYNPVQCRVLESNNISSGSGGTCCPCVYCTAVTRHDAADLEAVLAAPWRAAGAYWLWDWRVPNCKEAVSNDAPPTNHNTAIIITIIINTNPYKHILLYTILDYTIHGGFFSV